MCIRDSGFADLEHEDPSYGGRKQFWHVVAKDDAGDVVSEGTFITKIDVYKRQLLDLLMKTLEGPIKFSDASVLSQQPFPCGQNVNHAFGDVDV